jgi:tRNA(Ile)-lysidine synthase
MMQNEFEKFISKELQLTLADRILLTVSGGADSVLMLYLFWKAGYDCGIAHCNFHLREKDSDLDEALVAGLAAEYQFPFYKIDFDTLAYARKNGLSIEMAARELRYTWFEQIRITNNYEFIATAHHKDDLIETFFVNLSRGTGIRGLTGFNQKRNFIIRPMLFTDRHSIMNFVKQQNLEYREDKSNSDVKIIRNKLRHNIIPLFKEINQSYKQNILQTIENLQEAEILMNHELQRVENEIIKKDNDIICLDINKLLLRSNIHAYLFEILQQFGFNNSQVKDIEKALKSKPGKIFRSKTHELVKDRDSLIIKNLSDSPEMEFLVLKHDKQIQITQSIRLIISTLSVDQEFIIPRTPDIAAIDIHKLKFPLQIRKWEQGDYFYPLGMRKKKKISDFLIDEKCNLLEKKEIMLLFSDNEVVWVIGKRIDNRYKINKNTKEVLLIELIENRQ